MLICDGGVDEGIIIGVFFDDVCVVWVVQVYGEVKFSWGIGVCVGSLVFVFVLI